MSVVGWCDGRGSRMGAGELARRIGGGGSGGRMGNGVYDHQLEALRSGRSGATGRMDWKMLNRSTLIPFGKEQSYGGEFT